MVRSNGDEPAAWAAALGNDSDAFAVIFDLHRDRVYRLSLRMTANVHDAEDVTAAAFLELWRHRRSVRVVEGSVLPWLLVTATNLARNLAHGLRRYRALIVVGWLIAWPTIGVITKFVITPIVGASQRRYEYEADAAAKEIGLGAPLSSALRTMGAFETGRTGWEAAMAATHPPVELRVEALQEARPDDDEFQADDLEGPTGAKLRRIFLFWRKPKA